MPVYSDMAGAMAGQFGGGQAVSQAAAKMNAPKPKSRARKRTSTRQVKPGEGQAQPQGPQQYQQTAHGGFDQTQGGMAEQYALQNQNKLTQQGEGSQFFDKTKSAYSQTGAAEDFQKAQAQGLAQQGAGEQQWNATQGQMNTAGASEQLAQDPGLGAYYDRAKTRTAGDINNQLAARGSFGSSAGVQQIGDAMVGLEAERANREADYRKEVAGQADTQRMSRLGLAGELAQGAQGMGLDRTRLGGELAGEAQTQQMGRLGQGQDAAGQVDQFGLDQTMAGFEMAMGAQDQAEGRQQTGFDQQMAMAGAESDIYGGAMGGEMALNQGNFDSAQAIGMGEGGEDLAASYNAKEQMKEAGNKIINTSLGTVKIAADVVTSLLGKKK